MKNFLISLLMLLTGVSYAFGQANASIFILPDKDWANSKHYGEWKKGRNGKEIFIVNYERCFMDPEFKDVETAIRESFKNTSYEITSASNQSEMDDEDEMEEMSLEDEETGGEAKAETGDALINRFKPDIIAYISWNRYDSGARYSLSYRIDFQNSYTGKGVATITGQSELFPRSQNIQGVMQNLIAARVGELTRDFDNFYDDLRTNGREIRLQCKIMSNSDINFNTRFGDETLKNIIYSWMGKNTVNNGYTMDSSPNSLKFKQVRIPLTQADGTPMQAEQFVDRLALYLEKNYGINCRSESKKLGRGTLQINGRL